MRESGAGTRGLRTIGPRSGPGARRPPRRRSNVGAGGYDVDPVLRRRTTDELVARKPDPAALAALPRAPLHVVLADVRGLANVGLCFRLCDNLRAAHLHLTGITGHPPYHGDPRPASIHERCDREIRRTAVMAVPFVPWSHRASALEVLRERRAALPAEAPSRQAATEEAASGRTPTLHPPSSVRQGSSSWAG